MPSVLAETLYRSACTGLFWYRSAGCSRRGGAACYMPAAQRWRAIDPAPAGQRPAPRPRPARCRRYKAAPPPTQANTFAPKGGRAATKPAFADSPNPYRRAGVECLQHPTPARAVETAPKGVPPPSPPAWTPPTAQGEDADERGMGEPAKAGLVAALPPLGANVFASAPPFLLYC